MPITDWPAEDRPREKLLKKGEDTLTDAELVAIFLQSGTRGKTALDLARNLLNEFGSLNKLLRAPESRLIQEKGIGTARYAALKAAAEMGRRCIDEPVVIGQPLTNSKLTRQFLANRLRHHQNEVFACLFLDNHLRLIHFEELFHGSINQASIYPREIVRQGLAHNAAKLILAHNHPSGEPTPSQADKDATRLIKQALALIDIDVVDHVIIGNPDTYSFAEMGYL